MQRNRLTFHSDTPPTLHQWIELLVRSEDTHEPRLRPASNKRQFKLGTKPHRAGNSNIPSRHRPPPKHRVQAVAAVLLLEQLLDSLQIQDRPEAQRARNGLCLLLTQASTQTVTAVRLRTLLLELAASARARHLDVRLSNAELMAAGLLAFALPQAPSPDLPPAVPSLDQLLNARPAQPDQSLQACLGERLASLGVDTDYSQEMLDALKGAVSLLDDALGKASTGSGRLDLSAVDITSLDELALLGVLGVFIARRQRMESPITALVTCEELEDLPLYFREFSGLQDITLPDFAGEELDLGYFAALQRVTFTGDVPPALRQSGHLKLPHQHCEVVWPTGATPSV